MQTEEEIIVSKEITFPPCTHFYLIHLWLFSFHEQTTLTRNGGF